MSADKKRKEQLEYMRDQVMEVELQARYWKANHDVKFYTLEDDKLKEPYDTFVKETQEKSIAYLEELQSTQEKELNLETITEEKP